MAVVHNDTDSRRRGVGALLRELGEGSAALVRQEVTLVRLELSQLVGAVGKGTALVALGAVLALLGGLSLLTGVILLPGDQWLRDRYWLAALLVTLIAGVVAYVFVRRGLAQLSPQHL